MRIVQLTQRGGKHCSMNKLLVLELVQHQIFIMWLQKNLQHILDRCIKLRWLCVICSSLFRICNTIDITPRIVKPFLDTFLCCRAFQEHWLKIPEPYICIRSQH